MFRLFYLGDERVKSNCFQDSRSAFSASRKSSLLFTQIGSPYFTNSLEKGLGMRKRSQDLTNHSLLELADTGIMGILAK